VKLWEGNGLRKIARIQADVVQQRFVSSLMFTCTLATQPLPLTRTSHEPDASDSVQRVIPRGRPT
jgi:hypothetical protein